jgi:phage/plasmid-like protein (TIGR03299 family)
MSHGLTQRKDGFVEMAYSYEDGLPWHKLGQGMRPEATIDEWKVDSGCDFKVLRSGIRFATSRDPAEALSTYDDAQILFRSDNKMGLGIASPKYKIFQPGETLELFRDLVGVGGFKLSAAGTLFGGRRFWATAKIGADALIIDKDQIDAYLLVCTSVDGSMPTTIDFTGTRGVCQNTINLALSSASKYRIKISHRQEVDFDKVKKELGIGAQAYDEFVNAAKRLALTTINKAEAQQLTGQLLIDAKAVTKADVATSSGFKTILDLFQHGKGNHGETAWDWVNGVTEYVDHVQRAKSDSHRMANSMFGKGDALKTMAFERALAIAE